MSSTDPSKLSLNSFLDNERSFAATQDRYERNGSDVIDRIEEEEEEIERRLSQPRRPSVIDEILDGRNTRKASVLSTKSEILKELTKPLVAPKKYSLTDDQVEQFQDILLNNDNVIQPSDTKMDLVISKEKRSSIDSISSTVEEIERKMSMNEEMERKRSIHKEYERRKSISSNSSDERRASYERRGSNDRRGSNTSQTDMKSETPRKTSEETRRVSFEMDNIDKNGKRTVLSGPNAETSETAATSIVKPIIEELNETAIRPPRKLKVESGVLDAGRRSTSSNLMNGGESNTPRTSFNEPFNNMKQLIHPNNDSVRKFDEIALRPMATPMPLSPQTSPKPVVQKRPISSMEEESLRERARIRLLRQIAEYLETIEGVGSKINKESFRRVFLNKVREILYKINLKII